MALLATAFDGHVKAIGIIAVHWWSLDNTVYEILQKPFNLMEEAEKFPGFDSGMKRLNKLKEWLQSADLSQERKHVLIRAVDRLCNLYKHRNSIMHGQYGIMFDEKGDLFVS